MTQPSPAEKPQIALVTSKFNREITDYLQQGALDFLEIQNIKPLICVQVPGAMEIPLALQQLLSWSKCEGVIVLGAVIRGQTSHYDIVCQSVERNCSALQLKYKKPMAFGVLTTENKQQALARCGISQRGYGRWINKGEQAAKTLLDMLEVMKNISQRKKNSSLSWD